MSYSEYLGKDTSQNNYSWNGVIEFLQEQERSNRIKQNEWLLERQQLTTKISKLQGEVKAHEQINEDLMRRVKMLEYCLRQERLKQSQGNSDQNPNYKDFSSIKDINEQKLMQILEAPKAPKKRAKGHQTQLLNFLEEIGYDDIFQQNNNTTINNNASIQQQDQSVLGNMNGSVLKDTNKSGFLEGKSTLLANDENNQSLHPNDLLEEKSIHKQPVLENSINTSSAAVNNSNININANTKGWQEVGMLKGHFDGIRGMFCIPNSDILCTVSEDCMVKLWSLAYLENADEISCDSYMTFRQHMGPLFTTTGTPSHINYGDENIIFTAGSEGIICAWKIPQPDDCNNLESSLSINYCAGRWAACDNGESPEPIWQLQHHPINNLLMSTCADGYIKIWEINADSEELTGKLQSCFYLSISEQSDPNYLLPTSSCWLPNNSTQLVSGHSNSNSIFIFDIEQKNVAGSLKFQGNNWQTQPNKIISHPTMDIIISGHEDGTIKYFDLNSNKLIQSIQAHQDGISDIHYLPGTTNLVSVAHDGFMKIWDIKKFELTQQITNIHKRKYDEVIHCVTSSYNSSKLLSGGADGVVKVYEHF